MRYSIQEIPNAVEHSSSDRNVQAARHARSSNLARWNRRAGQLDQLDRIAAVERQFQNPLVLDDGSHTCGLRFNERRIGLDLHLFIDCADLKRDVDRRN